jgi:Protein of unknown function (DUF3102)
MNARSLNVIAGEINRIDRARIFNIGDLFLEARDACEHGEWGQWLNNEFAWSQDTAERYMAVARLAAKFRKLRNLKLAKTMLCYLADELEADLPSRDDCLAASASLGCAMLGLSI